MEAPVTNVITQDDWREGKAVYWCHPESLA